MSSDTKESLVVLSLLGGFVPLVFAIVCLPKYTEASLYWLKFAMTASIVCPAVGFTIDRVWRKVTKND
jgi:hypothetical protein